MGGGWILLLRNYFHQEKKKLSLFSSKEGIPSASHSVVSSLEAMTVVQGSDLFKVKHS